MRVSSPLRSRRSVILIGLSLIACLSPIPPGRAQQQVQQPNPSAAQQAPTNSQNSSAASAPAAAAAPAQRRADLIRKRQEWFIGQRAYPRQQVPVGAFQKALEQRNRMIETQRPGYRLAAPGIISFPGDGVWHPMGPQPTNITSFPGLGNFGFPTVSGRVNAIAVDPADASGQTVYLGGAAGGVWKTTDGGANWTPLTDNQPSLAIGSIAIDPNNHLTIYAGTGEENFNVDGYTGTGILKSTDGGVTWNLTCSTVGATCPFFGGPLASPFGGTTVGAISVQPGGTGVLLAAMTSHIVGAGGIFRSTDGGATWTQVIAGLAGTDVVFDPGTPANAYAAMGWPGGDTPNGIYKSTNGGQTWSLLSTGLTASNFGRITLGFARSTTGNTATLYAAIANALDPLGPSANLFGLIVTTNGGTTWTQLGNAPNFCSGQCFYDMAVAVHPTNPNFIVVGGSAYTDNSTTLFRSTDGGATWTTCAYATCTNPGSASTANTDFTIGSSSVRPHVDTHAIVFSPPIAANGNIPRLYTGDDGGIWRTDNPTVTAPDNPLWVGLNGSTATPSTSLALSQFYPGTTPSVSDENYGAGGTQDNDIQIFSGSLAWNNAPACGDGGYTAFDPTTPTTIYAGCNLFAGAKVTKSVFYGQFTPPPNPSQSFPSFLPAETAITSSGDTMGFIPPLAIDVNSGISAFNLTTLYFGTCRLWDTLDSATTWNPITGDLTNGNTPVTSCATSNYISAIDVSQKSSSIIFAGTSNGKVWQTSLGAGLFTEIDNGLLPPRHVTATRPLSSDTTGNTGYVTFSGFGSCVGCDGKGHVFVTTNANSGAAATWTDISGDLPDAPVNDILPDFTNGVLTLYIGTDVGVFSCNATATPACPNWTVLGDPLPNSPVVSLGMRRSARILRVGTHGRSMYDIQLTNQQPGPLPLLSGLTPAAVVAGAAATAVTVTGVNFSSNTLVLVDGAIPAGLTTTFVSTTQLTVNVPANLLTAGAVFQIGLSDPLGASNQTLPFTVMNIIPNVTGESGTSGIVGEPVPITITGSGFVAGTTLTITQGAVSLTESFGSVTSGGTQDVITIPDLDSARLTAGSATVTVSNPLPGGGPALLSNLTIFSFNLTMSSNPNSEITFTPPFASFSGTNPGTTNPTTVNIQLTNNGNAGKTLTLMANSAVLSGLNASDFTIVAPTSGSPVCIFAPSGAASMIAVGGSCWFGLTFTVPSGTLPGFASASLAVSDADADTDTEFLSISGLVTGPTTLPEFFTSLGNFCVISACFPTPVNYGSVPKGFPVEIDGTVENAGTTALTGVTLTILPGANSADFTIGAPSATAPPPACSPLTGPFSLPTQASLCSVGLTFTPSSVGVQENATLEITFTNAGLGKIDVPLTGIGVAPTIDSISPNIVATHGPAFTLTVNGKNFALGSVVNLNGNARLTTFGSATQLLASIPAGDLSAAGSFAITVTNPNGGGTSEPKTLIVAAAPIATNDDFNFAIDTSTTPFHTTEDTTLATTNTGARLDPTNFPAGCVPVGATLSGDAKSVWFKFTAPAAGNLVVSTRDSSYRTILSVWTGAPGGFTSVGNGCASGNIVGSAPLQSVVTVGVAANTTYYIMVTDATASVATGGVLTLNVDFASAAPANDGWDHATAITAPAAGAVYSNTVNTILATPNTDLIHDPTPSCAPAGSIIGGIENSVWYSFTPASNTPVTADTLTSDYATILSVWTASGSPPNVTFTAVAGACNATAVLNGTQVVQSQVTFNATGGTAYYFMISSVNADGGTTNFHLSLTSAATANLSIATNPVSNPPTLNFPNTTVGDASAIMTAVLTNNGPGSVTLTSINGNVKTGDFVGAPFTAGDCSDGSGSVAATVLAVSGSCNLRGIFTPTTTGARQVILTISASGAVNSPTLTLNGTGVANANAGNLTASPASLTFADQNVNTSSAALTVVLTNTGTGDATIVHIKGAGANPQDFSVAPFAAGDCEVSLTLKTTAPNNQCNFRVIFTPSAAGARSAIGDIDFTNFAAVTVAVNASGNGASATTIAVNSGSGQVAALSSPFGAPLVALVTDGSSKPIEGVTVTFTAPTSGASGTFANGTNTTNAVTNVNGLATSSTFTANGVAGNNYTVTASASGVTTAANFTLSNAAGANLSFTGTTSANTYDYGSVVVGTTVNAQVALKNNGPGSVTVTNIGFGPNPGNDFKQALPTTAGDCSLLTGVANGLASGSSCNLRGTFTPSAVGLRSTTLTTTATGAANSPIVLNLKGTGTAGAATKLVFTTTPGNSTAGTAFAAQPVVAIEDASGNVETTDNSDQVTLAILNNAGPGGALTCTTNPVTVTAGVATFAGCSIDKTGVGYTLKATSGALTQANSSAFNITAGAAAKLVFTTTPGNSTAGTAFAAQPVVTVEDAGGNTVTTDNTDQVTLAILNNAGPGGTLTCTTNPVTVTAGVATFAGCKIDKAGVGYTLKATSGVLTQGNSTAFNITAGAAAKLVFTTQPGGGTAATAWTTQPVLTVQDAGGNTVTTDNSDQITLAILNNAGPGGALTCTTNPVTVTAGVATFARCKIDKAGTGYTLKATSGVLTQANSSAFNITVGSATQLVFTTSPGNSTAGTAFAAQPVVAVEDAGGNTVTTDNSDQVTLAILNNAGPGGTLTCTTNPVTVTAGVATFAGCNINKTGVGYTLKATSGVLTQGNSTGFNITAGVAAKLVFTISPGNSTAGLAFAAQPVVTVEDANGNTVTTDNTDPVTLAVLNNAGPGGTLTCTANPVTVAAGIATFAGCKIDKAGTGYTLKATSGVLTQGNSTAFNITAGAAAKLVFTTSPSNSTAGLAFAAQPVVTVEDANGNTATTDNSDQITLAILNNAGPGGTLTCTANPVTVTGGVATFVGCKIDKTGTGYTLKATSGVLTQGNSSAFNITTNKLVFTTQPIGATGGAPFTTQPVVTVEDGNGNPVTTDNTDQVTLTITSGTGTAGATLTCTTNTVTVTNGVAAFAGCKIDKAGSGYTLTATSPGLAIGSSTVLSISVGAAAQLAFTIQPGGGTSGTAWTTQPAVTVQDAGGNTVTTDNSDQITLAILNNAGPGGTLTCTINPVTVTAGVATFAGCKIDKAGTGYTLKATSGALTQANSGAFNITPGAATQLVFTTSPGNSTGGTPFATQPVVAIEDASGNIETTDNSDQVTLAILNNAGPGGTLTCTTNAVTVTAGVATFAGCKIDKAGTGYTLKATSGVLTQGNSTAFNITAGAAAKLVFTASPGNSTAGLAFAAQPVVAVEDAGGNTVTTDNTDQVTLAILNNAGPGGTLTCTTNPVTVTAGVATFAGCNINKTGVGYTLKATSGALTQGNSSAFNITPGAAAKLAFTTQPGGGTNSTPWTTQPVVTIEDANGNTVTTDNTDPVTLAILNNAGPGGTLTCAANPVTVTAGVATFAGCNIDKTGNGYTLTATSGVLAGATSNPVNITMGKLVFTTQPGGGTGGAVWTTQPVVAVQDLNGNTITTSSASITLTITSGTGTAGSSLTCTSNPLMASSGVATFGGCKIDKAGSNYTLTASGAGLTSGTSSMFNITVGSFAQLAFTTQPGGGTGGAAWTTQPAVTVQDAGGNTVTTDNSDQITLAILNNAGPGGTLTCTTNSVTVTAGVATFAGCKIDKAGTGYTLKAASGALTQANSGSFNITVGAAAQLAFTTQPGGGTSATAWTQQPAVTVEDAGGNILATDNTDKVMLAILNNAGPGGTLSCTTNPVTVTAGVAAFAGCKIDKAGNGYTLTATGGALTSATSAAFSITAGAAAKLAFTAQPSGGTSATPWATQPAVTVEDASGNTVTNSSASITLAITNGTGATGAVLTCTSNPVSASSGVATFAACKIDLGATSYMLTATSGVLTSTSAAFSVIDFTLALHTPMNPFPVTAGTPANVQLDLATIPANSPLAADVNYTCAFTMPASLAGASCAVNPTKTAAGSMSGNTTLMITTTATLIPSPQQRNPWSPSMPWTLTTMLAAIMMLFLATRQKIVPLRGRAALASLALLMIAAGGLTGCTTSMNSQPPTPTPKGPASVTVTATSGNDVKNVPVNINVM